MSARGVTRAQVLATAQDLFSRQGYHATGVNQILDEAAAPKGSLYFHFPGGKKQLAAEAVNLGAEAFGRELEEVLAETAGPVEALGAITERLARRLEDSDFLEGCPVATVALDAGDIEPVRQECWNGYQGWLGSITRHLAQAGVPEPAAYDVALLVLSALEGAMLLAATQHDAAPVRRVGAQLAALLAGAVPQ
jgi:TetR/AcrR family transcriptional repressor of lmrAB and yxaGH operons